MLLARQLGASNFRLDELLMTLWALGTYFVLVLILVVAMLVVSYLLGQRHREHATGSPYESGILSEGSAHVRLSAKFYLVAMFFVVFDLEAVFIFAWAIAGRELGWSGYWEVLIFTGVLISALVYLWRLGALDWGEVRSHLR
jgi:NADH-quinone oxidoreductase subunit A